MKKLLVLGIIAAAAYMLITRPGCGRGNAVACPAPELEEGLGQTLAASTVCPRAGFLCAETQTFQVIRWPLSMGRIRVRITRPDFTDAETGKLIQELVAEGVRQWDGHPFPVEVETGRFSLRIPDASVVWSEGLYNSAAGLATYSWEPRGKTIRFKSQGLAVVVPPLEPGSTPSANYRAIVKAIAMHEMGHVLGLIRHSGSTSDVMYPLIDPNAPKARLSSRDLASVDALYRLPNGAMVQ